MKCRKNEENTPENMIFNRKWHLYCNLQYHLLCPRSSLIYHSRFEQRRDATRVSVDFRVIPKQYYQTVYKDCLRLDGQPRFSVGAYYQETGPLSAAAAVGVGSAAAPAAGADTVVGGRRAGVLVAERGWERG